MRKNRSSLIIFLLVALAILSLACAVTRKEPAAESQQETINTAVAAAQTAVAVPAATQAAPATELPPATEAAPATEAPPPTEAAPAAPLQAVFTDPNNNLWIWKDGTPAQQLDSSGEVEYGILSDDGSQVAYLRTPDYLRYSLWIINADGSDQRQLLSHEQLMALLSEPGHESLSPDSLSYTVGNLPYGLQWISGQAMLSFTSSPRFEGPGLEIVGDIYQLHPATGARLMVFEPARGGLPSYSPDGTLVAIVTPTSISLANAAGGSYHANLLTYPSVITYSEYMYYPWVLWAPDSSHFKVVIPPENPLAEGPINAQIWQVNADGSPGFMVGSINNYVPFSRPQLSPDLTRVAYERPSGAPADNIHELHNASVGGAEDLLIHTGSLGFVSHHPDSQRFIFWLDDPTNYQLALLGGSFGPLTDTGYARNVMWINNDSFLFFNFTGSAWQLRRQAIGSPSTVLVEFAGTKDFYPVLDLSGGLE